MTSEQEYDYRGKRGVVLLRVSTEEQEKKYGFPSQLRSVREKLLKPLGIRIPDEDKYIVKDTYTGMEFREREALTKILEMAKRREFDVLVMDVLDRLGRTGLPREIYRAELRMNGVRILTTKPDEHADDDSLMGEMIRLIHGFKSETERNDIIRRTQNGKRERVLQDHKLLGTHPPLYGYKFKDDDHSAYMLNNDPLIVDSIILLDENGEPWTEVKVVCFIFKLADEGCTIRGIAKRLTSLNIPSRKGKNWHPATVSKMLNNTYYIGKAAVFKLRRVKERGEKPHNVPRPENEQIFLPEGVVPAILLAEEGRPNIALFERVQKRLEVNQKYSARNNQQPKERYGLLRAGLAHCGYCGGNLTTFYAGTYKNRRGYRCIKSQNGFGRCQGVTIEMSVLDNAVWSVALKIIGDPSEVNRRVEARKTADLNAERRDYIKGEIAKTKAKQTRLRDRLEDEDLDDDTYTDIKRRLKELADQKAGYEEQLTIEVDAHEEWKKTQEELKNFHKRCQDMSEQLVDPNYDPDYAFKREAIEFFGIEAVVWKADHNPRIDIQSNPPSIVSAST